MTPSLVKLVLTLGLGLCCLQGISGLDDRVEKLGKSLAKTKTKLMKADETLSQCTTNNCQLLAQQTTKNNEIPTHLRRTDETIGQLRTQNAKVLAQHEKFETMIKKQETMIKKLETQNEKFETMITELVTQNKKSETMITELVTQNKKSKTKYEKLLTQTEKVIPLLSKKGVTSSSNAYIFKLKYLLNGKLLTSIASLITDTEKAIDDINDCVIGLPTTCAGVHISEPRPIVTLLHSGITVMCDTTTDNGGWFVFQRRTSGEQDFYKDWQQYKDGFGVMPDNFWLGLEAIHQLTSGADHELRVDIKFKGKNYYALYDSFHVRGEDEKYKLDVSDYTGDAGSALHYHDGQYFSTKDRDHDNWREGSCAQLRHGAWWYDRCQISNLNGLWGGTGYPSKGATWYHTTDYNDSVSFSEMKFRPRRP